MAKTNQLTTLFANTGVLALSTLVFYLAAEILFFRFLSPYAAISLQAFLPETARVFIQYSKAGYAPANYVVLLGDSYAEGVGDWLLATGGLRAAPYHSANVVQELTKQDTVSFGKGGAGSAEGMVLLVTRTKGCAGTFPFPALADPQRIIVYFYEGNDLENNFEFLQLKVGAANPETVKPAVIDRYLHERYGNLQLLECQLGLAKTFLRMVWSHIKHGAGEAQLKRDLAGGNRIVIAGEAVFIPGELQGPALQLRPGEIKAAVLVFERSLAWLRTRFPMSP